jgi:CRISPR-associated protein Csc2
MFLKTIEQRSVFHTSIPARPMGKYAHVITLRETNSFSLFQTDQDLNFARVSLGRDDQGKASSIISRVVLFKRKQTTPERLIGRELLRRYHLIREEEREGDEALRYCEYNSEKFCKHCPDCIYYGFAIGQEGSERSKVLVDSAFSLTNFDESHQSMTFNAPYEHGTMSQNGSTKSSFGEQDHVLPQVFFPSVVTIHDPTEAGFIYVLNNLLRTKRYGAQTTRTGALENHVIAVVFTDGEIFSNLKLTQTLSDLLKDKDGQIVKGPYQASLLREKLEATLPDLLKEDFVTPHLLLRGETLKALLAEVTELVTDEQSLIQVLKQTYAECEAYSIAHGAGAGAAKRAAQEANKKNKTTKGAK